MEEAVAQVVYDDVIAAAAAAAVAVLRLLRRMDVHAGCQQLSLLLRDHPLLMLLGSEVGGGRHCRGGGRRGRRTAQAAASVADLTWREEDTGELRETAGAAVLGRRAEAEAGRDAGRSRLTSADWTRGTARVQTAWQETRTDAG